jgi:multiple sugar transport system permease protein
MSPARVRSGRTVAYYVGSAALAAIFLFPVVWTVWSSIHGAQATKGGEGVGVDNYRRLIDYGEGFGRYFVNSVIVSTLTVAGTLAVSLLGGYAFAYLPFRGRSALFIAALAILMVPYTTLLIPLYILLQWLGLQNSLVGLSLVLIMLQLPFGLFMMRNSFEALPSELEDAALVDGCSRIKALYRIVLPVSLPGILTVVIFAFSLCVNEFIYAFTFISSSEQRTVSAGIPNDLIRGDVFFWQSLMAATLIPAIPLALLYNAFLDRFIKGFTGGAFR